MRSIKPWQIALFVVAGLVLAGSLWFSLRSKAIDMADSITMIDVTTGDVYIFSTKGRKGVFIPEDNPDTGMISLMPIHKEGADWYVPKRYLAAFEDLDVPVNAVDPETGLATPSENDPKRVN